jgi:hypothetical protein
MRDGAGELPELSDSEEEKRKRSETKMPPDSDPPHTLGTAASTAVHTLASPPDLGRLVGVQESV